MQYTQFIIEKYKGITDPIIINVSKDKLTPIIGINECGKTTILQGIFAFDHSNDTFNTTVRHMMDVNNLYDSKSNKAIVKAEIKMFKKELKDILCDIENKCDLIISGENIDLQNRPFENINNLKNEINKFSLKIKNIDNEINLLIQRNLVTKKYKIIEPLWKLGDIIENEISIEIIRHLPYILYFDDFRDSIENKIEIPIEKTKATAWFNIIKKLFEKADEEIDIYIIPLKEERQRKSIISKVKKLLNKTITREWETFKLDDREALEIDIDFIKEDGKNYIKLDIIEKDSNGEEHFFYIRDRSKGFYWFFNFVMKLEFNPKIVTTSIGQNAIYLLDEPGSYLHALAQQKLCKKLAQLSKENIVIYCTHSHYLLNPEIIPLNCIKITEKDNNGKISLLPIFDYKGNITEKRTAFQPVWDALNIKPSLYDIQGKNVLIVEGIYDYYCYSLFKNKDWVIMPSVGADSIKYFISLLIAWGIDYRALWDNDDQGRKKLKEAEGYFGKEISSRTFRLLPLKNEKSKNCILQNLFEGSDLKSIKEKIGLAINVSFEKTILGLFYNEKRDEMLKNISEKTQENFKKVFEKL